MSPLYNRYIARTDPNRTLKEPLLEDHSTKALLGFPHQRLDGETWALGCLTYLKPYPA